MAATLGEGAEGGKERVVTGGAVGQVDGLGAQECDAPRFREGPEARAQLLQRLLQLGRAHVHRIAGHEAAGGRAAQHDDRSPHGPDAGGHVRRHGAGLVDLLIRQREVAGVGPLAQRHCLARRQVAGPLDLHGGGARRQAGELEMPARVTGRLRRADADRRALERRRAGGGAHGAGQGGATPARSGPRLVAAGRGHGKRGRERRVQQEPTGHGGISGIGWKNLGISRHPLVSPPLPAG